jgi:hypothetical protein
MFAVNHSARTTTVGKQRRRRVTFPARPAAAEKEYRMAAREHSAPMSNRTRRTSLVGACLEFPLRFPIGKYLIVYEIVSNEVVVLYVRHSARTGPTITLDDSRPTRGHDSSLPSPTGPTRRSPRRQTARDAAREAIHRATAEAETPSRRQTAGNCSSSPPSRRINCAIIPAASYGPLSPTGC